MKVITKRRWRVVNARPPAQGPPPTRVSNPRAPQDFAARDGIIEAVARSLILGFREDIVVRIRTTNDGTRIDARSASRYGRSDFGSNATRVRNLMSDIDDILTRPAPPEKEEKKPARPNQPPDRDRSAKR
jgi:hypothetical protein